MTPVSRARRSPVPGGKSSRLWVNDQSQREQHLMWPIIMTRVVCKFPAGPEVVVCDHGRKNLDEIWRVFIFNYVEFTQGKLRIASDTTVNDYLCCNGVKCLGPSLTHSSLTNDTWLCRIMRRLECKLFITSVTFRLSPNQWIVLLPMLIFKRHLKMSHTIVTTPGTLQLLLARDYSWPVA